MGASHRESNSSSSIPWREMFQTAASPQASIPHGLRPSRSSSDIAYPRSPAPSASEKKKDSATQALKPPRLHLASLQDEQTARIAHSSSMSNGTSSSDLSTSSTPPKETSYPTNAPSNHVGHNVQLREQQDQEAKEETWKFHRGSFQLALYIAMAHAGLIFLVLIMYGVWKLLEDYRKPIQWAVLCSMPLREFQETMVKFWEPPLRKGLLETLLAIPLAIYKALAGTLLDAWFAVQGLLGKVDARRRRKVHFSTLIQWLLSFAILTLSFEFMGPATLATTAFVGMIAYAAGTSIGLIEPITGYVDMEATWSMLSAKHAQQGRQARSWLGWVFSPFINAYKLINTRLTRGFAAHLHTVIAIWLICIMIVGSVAGLVLFSYKIGLEGKDAVVALKTHVQNSNYAEKVGLKQWIEDNNVPELVDTYTAKAYQTVSEQIDVFAAQYNMTELAEEGKKYILGFGRGKTTHISASESSVSGPTHPVLERLRKIKARFRDYDIKGVYSELEQAAIILLEHFHLSKEDLIDKAKQVGQRCLDVGKQVAASSSTLVTGSTNILLSVANSIASGAAELINFITQAIVFFSLLYYLITSKSGGVMDQVLGMVPLSKATRKQCATVLDHTVSSLLLATAKAAIFQAVFTWLLFRFLNIHFLYMSTMLAFFSAVLPIIPGWLPTLLAGAQLAFGEQYIQAILVMAGHMWIMDFGVSAIQDSIPGYNAYLTGLSIAGGMALFSPALEGAIMGPLIMTVLMSVKELYSEFVLGTAKT